MENVLSLSLENQNHVTNPSIFSQIKRDSGRNFKRWSKTRRRTQA
jgi:hypothetical protein